MSLPALRTYRKPSPASLPGGYVKVNQMGQRLNTELIPPMTTYMPPQYIDSGKAEFGNALNNPVLERDGFKAAQSTGRIRRIPTWSTQDQWWAGPDLVTNEINMWPDSDPTLTAGEAASRLFPEDMSLYPVNLEGFNTVWYGNNFLPFGNSGYVG